jgi:hypothetical protein
MPVFPYEFSLASAKKVIFKNSDQLSRWCEKELENWNALNGAQLPFHQNIYAEIQSPIERVRSALSNYTSLPDQSNFEQDLRSWLANLSQMITNSQYICSDAPMGVHIREAAKKDRELGAAAYFLAIQPNNSSQNFTRLTATASSFLALYYLGISPDTARAAVRTVEESSLAVKEQVSKAEMLEHEVSTRLNAVEQTTERRLERLFKLVADQIKSKRVLYRKRRDETVSELLDYVKRETKTSREKIMEFEEFTKNKVALQGPIHYWQNKRWWHRLSTGLAALGFVGYLGLCAKIASSTFWTRYQSVFDFLDQWRDAGLGAVAVLGGFLAVALMLARVLYRLFASQLHLWNDASERVTMIQTYLALAEKGHAKEEFLGALLSRLFSPASDGIVRDDLGAIGPIDLASKFTGSRQ